MAPSKASSNRGDERADASDGQKQQSIQDREEETRYKGALPVEQDLK